MKKVIVTGIVGVFVLGMSGCGGGHLCEAYREADFTKYKTEKMKKEKLSSTLIRLTDKK